MSRPLPPAPDDATQNGPPLVLVEGEENTTVESPRRISLGEDSDDENTVSELRPASLNQDDGERTAVDQPKPRGR